MQRLSDDALRACDEPGNALALVRIDAAHISAPGTRSEHVKAQMTLEKILCGTPPAKLEAWSFTSKGDLLVTPGRRYVVALMAAMGYARWGIGERVEVPEGQQDEAVRLHLEALKALQERKD